MYLDGEVNGSTQEEIVKNVLRPEKEIYSIGSARGPRVFVKLNMKEADAVALADSGADISVVSAEFYHKFKSLPIDRSVKVNIKGVGRSALSETLGIIKIPVTIDKFTASDCIFHVVDSADMSHDVILGADFMFNHYIAPSPAHQRLIYAPPLEPPCLIGSAVHFSMPLTLKSRVKLKPNTMNFMKIDKVVCPWNVVMFEPCPELREKAVVMCRSLENISNGIINLEAICCSQGRVTLEKDMLLGHIWAVEAWESGELPESNSEGILDSFDFSESNLTEEQIRQVKEVLRAHPQAISQDDDDVGRADIIEHEIKFVKPDQQPIKIPPRRFHGALKEGIEQEVQKLYDDHIIERSDSPWSAPVVPVIKPDKSVRLCVDYRALNKVTNKDAFPLPNIEDALYNLSGFKYFTTLDLVRGYYQVPMSEESKQYTAFSTYSGHWQFRRMPFGLCNAPATFQRLMNAVLSEFSWDRVMAYLDDIIIMDETFEGHLIIFDKLLSCLARNGLKVKPSKCQLFRNNVKFLGHEVSVKGLKPLKSNIQGILNFLEPKTVRQVHRFVGMVNFYRRFIPNCSIIMKPLNQLLSQSTGKFLWTSECRTAWKQLKDLLINPPILSYPDFSSGEPFELFTDASHIGAGACLMQCQQGHPRTIAYVSMKFNKDQLKYSVLDKELAAIRWAVKRLKPFLWGHKFIIYCDHKPLTYLQSVRLLDGRLARTFEELGEYDFEIRYFPGTKNTVADALSRSVGGDVVELPEDPDLYLDKFSETLVKGGADTLFRCFSLFLHDHEDEHPNLRLRLVNEILAQPKQYNIELDDNFRKQLKVMRNSGIMPIFECIQSFANFIHAPVLVYENSIGFIRYEPSIKRSKTPACYIRSYDGVYFTLLREKEGESFNFVSEVASEHPEVEILFELIDDTVVIYTTIQSELYKRSTTVHLLLCLDSRRVNKSPI